MHRAPAALAASLALASAGCGGAPPAPATPATPTTTAAEAGEAGGAEAAPPAAAAPESHDAHDAHDAHASHDAHAAHGAHGDAAAHEGHRAGHHGGGMHGFQNAEAWAKVFDDPARDAWQQPARVLEALALTPALVVADIGAGTGYFAVRLARAVPRGQVIATDVEPDMVRYLTERARREQLSNLRAVETPPDSPRLAPASVDRVLVVDVWHHLGDRAAYARHLAAALRPGGRIVVVDFKLDATRGPRREHRLAPEAIAADLRAAGLTAELSPVSLPEQYIVVARR